MSTASCSTTFLESSSNKDTTAPFAIPDVAHPFPKNKVSPAGFIHVLDFAPKEGEYGVPITVRIHLNADPESRTTVRLIVGQKVVTTKVSQLSDDHYGWLRLDAIVPPFDPQPLSKVLLSVQALNKLNNVVDSITFGEFLYWSTGMTSFGAHSMVNHQPPRLQINTSIANPAVLGYPSATYGQSSRSPISPASTASGQENVRLHRRMKSNAATTEPGDGLYAQTPILELVTPLSTVCENWSPAEVQAGRRLARFDKVLQGRRLIVSCSPIRQDEYCENDNVISCIYRQEVDTYFITSVDVIYLLERLTNSEFPVEEKNRIRRNLEGFRPITVSKHKPGFSEFFQRIMEFPDPKPRNIEKDLKVFEWSVLGQALEKILSKYSIFTTAAPDSEESTPVETPITPNFDIASVNSPSSGTRSTAAILDGQPMSTPIKREQKPEELALVSPSSASSVFSHAAVSPPAAAASIYPLFAAEFIHPTETICPPWATNLKPNGLEMETLMVPYDSFGSGYFLAPDLPSDGPPYNYGLYDGYSFDGISDQTLDTMADQYQLEYPLTPSPCVGIHQG